MYSFRKLACIVALLAVTTIAYGQQRYPNTLLWRISGKGLKQPSYLFGTMHLTDKRLFQFGDSVYQAIEKSQGLAIELNPDELGAYMVNKILDEAESKKLQEVLNEKDYNKYRTALAKKFKKPANKITTRDIVKEKNKWMEEYLEKGEMPTFVDAYLYNIARRQGKWLGGIEDMGDQSGLMSELVDKSDIEFMLAGDSSHIQSGTNQLMERMIELYTSQNISGIEALTSEESGDQKDMLLIKRNIKMARRIDSLLALRTMFVAIGAAHLPGDSGVIQLLQGRGFSVEPVFSSKKIEARKYTFKEVTIPWAQTEDAQGLYKVSMPGNPANIKLYGIIEMKFLFDIINLSAYCTMAVINTNNALNTVSKDSMLNTMARHMFKNNVIQSSKKIFNNGIEGKEYVQMQQGENIRLQAFVQDKVIYLAFMYAMKKDILSSADAGAFFSSFSVNKNRPAVAGSYTFTDPVMGISFVSPAQLTYSKKLSSDKEDAWHVSGFTGTDMTNGTYVILFSKDVKPAHYFTSDSLIQSNLEQHLKSQYTAIQKSAINIQGCNGIRLKGRNILQPNLCMDAISLIKNNRNIVLLVVTDSTNIQSAAVQKIFSSLQFIPTTVVNWKLHSTPDSLISARVPGPFRTLDNGSRSFFYAFDTTTASSYYIIPDTLNKYTWYTHDTTFWKDQLDYYSQGFHLEKETDITFNGEPGKEFLIKKERVYKRLRLLLHENNMYEVMIYGDKEFVYNNDATAFLNSFRINVPARYKNFRTQSKAAMLLQDIGDKDSATRMEANDNLFKVQFDKSDIPLLHEALFKPYNALFPSHVSDNINLRIATRLSELNDASTVTFIKESYPSLVKEKEPLKNIALAVLANIHTKESYTTLSGLLEQYGAPAQRMNYKCMDGFKDSLALTATIFSTLGKLAKDSAQSIFMAQLSLALKDNGYITQEQLASLQNDYIKAARIWLPEIKKADFYYGGTPELLQLVGSFNTMDGNNAIRSYLTAKDKYIRKDAAVQLIKNKQPVPATLLTSLAADINIRTRFYQDLKDLKKTALFPKQYLTRQYFAESALHEAEDDDEPEKIIFLSTKTATYKGKQYVFYLFKVVFDAVDEPSGYLGIAGGYAIGSKAAETVKDITGIYWEESYNATKINAHFKAYLKSMEE
jgi:uncharacterized protein YbaP (TraB family)